ncbi:MAG: isochorismate synthase [Solirubrobacterales bacterium]
MPLWSRSRRTGGRARDRTAAAEVESGFGPVAYSRLASRVDAAVGKARLRGSAVVAGVTVPVSPGIDPLARVALAREAGEVWSVFEQPARSQRAAASLGVAARVRAVGPGRFDSLAAQCATALDGAEVDDLADDPDAPSGAGTTWIGGFSFYDDGPHADAWRELPSAELVLPQVAIVRRGGARPAARMTINVQVQPDDQAADLLARVERLIERIALDRELPLPSGTGDGGDGSVSATAAPEHYEHAVSRATEMIGAGELEKVVLAREVLLRRGSAIDVWSALRTLRERFPECTTFAIGRAESAFIGASPELLIRREGRRASTMALAGSARRAADPEMDEHLGSRLLTSVKDNLEHVIVVRRIERTLGRLSAWVAVGERPELIKVKNIQHLATPIRAQLTEPHPAIELAGMLHPTPAVGGEPWPVAGGAIRSLEGFDRGWYAGGVGWMDQLEDGEFHVALRSALIEGASARLFVGAGIVADSDPATELAETETKLEALLPVLSFC